MTRLSKKCALFTAFCAAGATALMVQADTRQIAEASPGWMVDGGVLNLQLDSQALESQGFGMYFPTTNAVFGVTNDARLSFTAPNGQIAGFNAPGNMLTTTGAFPMNLGTEEGTPAGDLMLVSTGTDTWRVIDARHSQRDVLEFRITETELDSTGHSLRVGGDVLVSPRFALEMGIAWTDAPVGAFALGAALIPNGPLQGSNPQGITDEEGGIAGGSSTACQSAGGPDVIVGDITGPSNYAASGGIDAISLGTYSCNVGDAQLLWIANTNQHPVIGGNLFKLKTVAGSSRFEQVGMSWLKHGFFALSNNLCCTGCQGTDGSRLGIRCSDPYTSDRNGSQSGLGPKWQVNAASGAFTYPPANPSFSGSTARRLEVLVSDCENTSGTGVRYFGETMYITPDDAAANRKMNNASYREMSCSVTGSNATFGFIGNTVRESPAICAWKTARPGTVNKVIVDVPSDGRFIIGYEVTDLGGGMWHYEYAVYNQNSNRSGQALSLPIPAGSNLTNIGFHDIAYRNGDGLSNVNRDGTDWPATRDCTSLTWATQTVAQNTNANALRWGTLYNYRFDANSAPTNGTVTLTLYLTGSPTSVTFTGSVPSDPGAPAAPTITTHPSNASGCLGDPASFTVVATGPGLTYQWRKNLVNIGGATSATYNIAGIGAGDAGSYDVVVSNCGGSVTSNAATLTVDTPPTIITHPSNASACTGGSASFTVVASGATSYQWRKNNIAMGGANTATLTINPVTAADAGLYNCVVTNACGQVSSNNATLTVSIKGDANCDGNVDNFDIDAFVLAVSQGQAAWEAAFPGCNFLCLCDIDGSGGVNNFDIDPFVACLTGGGCP